MLLHNNTLGRSNQGPRRATLIPSECSAPPSDLWLDSQLIGPTIPKSVPLGTKLAPHKPLGECKCKPEQSQLWEHIALLLCLFAQNIRVAIKTH